MDLTLLTVLLGLGVGGLLGWSVPALIRRIPEPPPDDDAASADRAKEPYAQIAAIPGLGRCAVSGAICGGVVAAAVGWGWPLLLWWPLLPVLLALAVVDWRTRLLPRLLVLPATGFAVLAGGLVAVVTGEYDAWIRGLAGLLVARSVFWLLWRVHSAGMGFGDVRLAALLGFVLAFSGWAEWLVGLYAGFLVFALPGLLLAIVRRDRALLRTAYPFGPFMLVGALVGLLTGPAVGGSLLS